MNSDLISKELKMEQTHEQKHFPSPSNSNNSSFTFPFSYNHTTTENSLAFPTIQSSKSHYNHQVTTPSSDSLPNKPKMKRVGLRSNIQVTNLHTKPSQSTGTKKLYRGVRQRRWGKWVSEIRLPAQKGRLWLGTFASAEAAALEYDKQAFRLRGPTTKLNFPHLFKDGPHNELGSCPDVQEPDSLYGVECEHHMDCLDKMVKSGYGPQSSYWDDIDVASSSNLVFLPEITENVNFVHDI